MSKDVTTPQTEENPQVNTPEVQPTEQPKIEIPELSPEQKEVLKSQLLQEESIKYKKENESLKSWKEKIDAELKAKEEAELAAKGEWEELKKRQQEQIERFSRDNAQLKLKDKLKSAGVQNESTLNLIIKANQSEIEIGENGEATNIDTIVQSVQSDNPDFFKAPKVVQSTAPSTGGGGNKYKKFEELTLEDTQGMSLTDFAKLRKQSNS